MPSKISLVGADVYPDSRELAVQGEAKRIPWRAFDVLLLLMRRPGEVVAKEHLLHAVWGNEVVDASNLTQAIAQIRKALGEISPGVSYVETVPRIGYRIVPAAIPPIVEPIAHIPGTPEVTSSDRREQRWLHRQRVVYACIAPLFAVALVAVWFAYERQSKAQKSEVLELPFTAFEGDERAPHFSPDGREVVFTWARNNMPADIYLKDVDGENVTPFVTSDSEEMGPVFSPDGKQIAFLRLGGRTSRVYVKPRKGGAEQLIAETSSPHPAFLGSPGPYLAWTKAGDALIYASYKSLYLQRLDGRRPIRLTLPPSNAVLGDTDPALSPDGKTLVFSRVLTFGSSDLYQMQLNERSEPAGQASLLFGNYSWNRSPAWHPNGRWLIFTSGPWGRQRLWSLEARRPSSAMPIQNAGTDAQQATFSPAGDRVLFTRWFFRTQIWSLPLTSPGQARRQGPEPVFSSMRADNMPRLSRDATSLVFQSDRSGSFEVWSAKVDGSDLRRITSNADMPSGSPDLSPDGKSIAFDRLVGGQRDIYVCDSNGGNLRRLTDDPSDDVLPHWSADGRSIYFNSFREAGNQIWKAELSTGVATRVTRNGGNISQESLDGKTLYFTSKDDYSTPVFAMPSAGGPVRKVLDELRQRAMSITRNGLYFVSPQSRKDLQYLDFASGAQSTVVTIPDKEVTGVSVDPDSKLAMIVVSGPPPSDLMQIRGLNLQ